MNQATALAVDLYSRTIAAMFDEKAVIGVPTGFQSIFGRPETGGKTIFSPNAKLVEIDIMRGNERLAATILRGTETRPITGQLDTQTQVFTAFSRQYPLIEEEGNITADQILNRTAGESPYQGKTKFERMRIIALEHHQEHIRRIVRLQEVLAAQSAILGTQDAIFGTTNTALQYDFHRLATHTFTPAVKWDAGASVVIMDNIDAACALVRADGHVNPDVMILGGGAMSAFQADTDVKSLADTRRYELIQVSTNNPVPPKLDFMIAGGFIPRGRLRTPAGYELWMFTYTDVYTAAGGTATLYMNTEKVLIFASQARADRYFGPAEMLPITPQRATFSMEMFGIGSAPIVPPNIKNASAVVRPDAFYFDAYPSATHKSVTVRTQAAPIFAPVMTDAFVTMEDVLT